MAAAGPDPPAGGFAALDAALRSAVEAVAAADPTPTDPLRGLYITDDAALQTARGLDGATLDERIGAVAAQLGLGGLDAAILGLCLAPEADPSYGRLIAYLHDDVSRRRPSPRLLARLLSGPELSEPVVLSRLGASAPLRAIGRAHPRGAGVGRAARRRADAGARRAARLARARDGP